MSNYAILIICQWIFSGIVPLVPSYGPLILESLIGGQAWYVTIPVTIFTVSWPVGTKLLAILRPYIPEKHIFLLYALSGLCGFSLMAVGLIYRWPILFCVGFIFFGFNAASNAQFRFSALTTISPEKRNIALGFFLMMPAISAFTTLQLVFSAYALLSPFYLGTLLFCCFYCIVMLLLLFGLNSNDLNISTLSKRSVKENVPSPTHDIQNKFFNPNFLSIAASTVGYGLMQVLMTSASLELYHGHHFSHPSTQFVIQGHVVGMFAFSLIVGYLLNRFAFYIIRYVGYLILLACFTFHILSSNYYAFVAGMFLLGLGWSVLFFSSTSYFSFRPKSQQSQHDVFAFSANALGSFLSGIAMTYIGWVNLNVVCFLITLTFLLIDYFNTSKKDINLKVIEL